MGDREGKGHHGRDRDGHVGRAAAPMEAARGARDLAVGGQRVGQTGQPEHLPVHRGQQHGRGGRAHHVAGRLAQPVGVEGRDDAQDGSLDEAVSQRRPPVDDRLGHQGGRGDRDEQDHADGRAHDHHSAQAAPPHAHLARQAGGGLHSDHGDGGDDQSEQRVVPTGNRAELDRVGERAGIEELGERDYREHHEQADREQRQPEHHGDALREEAADVRRGHEGQRQPGQEDLQQAVVQVLPEDGEVVADDDRGGRHDDQVVEQDGPAGDEAPELVEGVAGERRGPAALGVQRGALEVGRARDHQEGSGQHVDERREAKGVACDHPQ